jgi:AcrR family transcriptional regulator
VNDVDRRLTARGAATRARIVASADELIALKGAAATTLDEVTAASGTSKSQLYRHFPDKSALVQAVIALRGGRVLEREEQHLRRIDSFSGLDRWCKAILQRVTARRGADRAVTCWSRSPRSDGLRAGIPVDRTVRSR